MEVQFCSWQCDNIHVRKHYRYVVYPQTHFYTDLSSAKLILTIALPAGRKLRLQILKLTSCSAHWRHKRFSHMSSACFIVQPFYKRSAQKGQSKQHCVCIKEKQNNSSQSFLRNPSTLKLPLAHVWMQYIYSTHNVVFNCDAKSAKMSSKVRLIIAILSLVQHLRPPPPNLAAVCF